VGQLGSIFEESKEESKQGTRGEDLHVEIEVPPDALGATDGFRAPLPLEIEVDGRLVTRADPHGDGEAIVLRLPESLPEGAVLKLRGLGGSGERPGDLYARIVVVEGAASADPPDPASSGSLWIALAVLVALAAGGVSIGYFIDW
jgi:hypothetical protein